MKLGSPRRAVALAGSWRCSSGRAATTTMTGRHGSRGRGAGRGGRAHHHRGGGGPGRRRGTCSTSASTRSFFERGGLDVQPAIAQGGAAHHPRRRPGRPGDRLLQHRLAAHRRDRGPPGAGDLAGHPGHRRPRQRHRRHRGGRRQRHPGRERPRGQDHRHQHAAQHQRAHRDRVHWRAKASTCRRSTLSRCRCPTWSASSRRARSTPPAWSSRSSPPVGRPGTGCSSTTGSPPSPR